MQPIVIAPRKISYVAGPILSVTVFFDMMYMLVRASTLGYFWIVSVVWVDISQYGAIFCHGVAVC